VTPLREGGSLPGLVEAEDDGMYVVKFSGAGQGRAALVAEVVVGELARRLGLHTPELVVIDVAPEIGRREPDQEVQELLIKSTGLNLGVDFLPGSVGYDGLAWRAPVEEAVRWFWLDAFTANVDRSWRNPNMLVWHKSLWGIDHGAALIFQHAWPPIDAWASRRYDLSQHVLRPVLQEHPKALPAADEELAATVDAALLAEVLALVPDVWLGGDPAAGRSLYAAYLLARLGEARPWRELVAS
jgi:hypothetical protein